MKAIQSLERGFAILQVVAQHPAGIGGKAISELTGLPIPTVSRFLATLEALAAVERGPDGKGFVIGQTVMALSAGSPFLQRLTSTALPFMQELVERSGETVGLSIPDGDVVLYLEQVQGPHHIQVRNWTGERYPMYATSAGKLFLAWRLEKALGRYLAQPLAPYTPHTITDPKKLRAHLSLVRSQGVAWSEDELVIGITGVAAPILGGEDRPVAAIHMSGPNTRFPPEGGRDKVVEWLLNTVRKIAVRLQLGL